MTLHLRRALVTVGVVLSLVLGLLAIRAAAAWTATSAPLSVAPVPAASITDRLAAEQARSTALQAQLDELVARSAELSGALEEAQARIVTDASTATDLRDRLAATEKKLAALTKSLRQAPAAQTTAARTAPAAAAPATPAPTAVIHEDDHEGGLSDD